MSFFTKGGFMSGYDESSIKILSRDEIEQFDWHRIRCLAEEYRRPVEWIERGFEAARLAGISPDYFVDKYIKHQPLEINIEFMEIYKSLMDEAKRGKGKR